MSNHVKDSIGDLTRRWPPNEIAYTVDKISMDLGSDRSGHDHSFEFIAMFAPLNNEITSAISTLAEDWWGFIPMEVLALSAAPEFIYQDQHWSVHPLAVSLLRSILDLRYSDLTIIPETGLDPGNMEHGYLFHTILSEY
jgi:hypothetical protein